MQSYENLPLIERVFTTLALIERRGYNVSLECLAEWLLGGPISPAQLRTVIEKTEGLHLCAGLVHTEAVSSMALRRTLERQHNHPTHRRRWWAEVERYVERLVVLCPQIRCVALAGSMAAGGFVETDDVDFNLFVEDGTRYTTYLQAAALALEVSLRHHSKPTDAHTRRWLLPKLMSVNVIWTDGDTRPFVRQDGAMALELFLSRPLWGEAYFRNVLGCNPWLDTYFPQFGARTHHCTRSGTIRSHASTGWCERLSYTATYLGWRWVMWTRRRNPEALARVALVRQYQSPYALFETPP